MVNWLGSREAGGGWRCPSKRKKTGSRCTLRPFFEAARLALQNKGGSIADSGAASPLSKARSLKRESLRLRLSKTKAGSK
jgi:hypothetical protein